MNPGNPKTTISRVFLKKRKEDSIVRIYNQKFQRTSILMVFELQGESSMNIPMLTRGVHACQLEVSFMVCDGIHKALQGGHDTSSCR